MNRNYKTVPCKYYPNCNKGKYCTFLHDEDMNRNKIDKIENIIKINDNEECNKEQSSHPFMLFIKEIDKFIEIYRNKDYIKHKLSENFWKKELKYFQNLNDYLENVKLE